MKLIMNAIRATKKKAIPINSSPNLIHADKEARNETKADRLGAVLSNINRLIFSITSKIPLIIGVKLIQRPTA